MIQQIPETVSVTLTPELREYIATQLATGRFESASDYFRELAEADEQAKGLERLEAELLKGLNSGPSVPMSENFVEELLQKVRERLSLDKP